MELEKNNLKISLNSTKATAKLNVKLSAYTKGFIPDVSEFIKDAPKEGVLWGRQDGEWVNVDDVLQNNIVIVDEDSSIERIEIDKSTIKLKMKEWIGKQVDFPETLQPYYTYYTYDEKPDLFLLGGTAYSDEDSEYGDILYGGNARTLSFTSELIPMNAKGEF